MTSKDFDKLDINIRPIFKIASIREKDRLKKLRSRYMITAKARTKRGRTIGNDLLTPEEIITYARDFMETIRNQTSS